MDAALVMGLVLTVSVILSLPGVLAFYRDSNRPNSGTYYQMEQTLASQNGRLDTQGRRIDELEQQLSRAVEEMGDLRRGVALLIAQLEEAKLKPVWTPPRRLQTGATASTLRKRRAQKFSVDEMLDLAMYLGVAAEGFAAATPSGYARWLVAHCERHGMLEELERLIQELRP